MEKKEFHELRNRLLFTILIVAVYIVGRSILLYNIDAAAYEWAEQDSQNIMVSLISGDRHQYTLFALGIMPYITAMLFTWIYSAIRGKEYRSRVSPRKMGRLTWTVMFLTAVTFAISRAESLVFKESDLAPEISKAIAILEMILGAVIIYGMVILNREHGIGAQIPIMMVNIVDRYVSIIRKFTFEELSRPLVLCLAMVTVILIMEIKIVRMPVQRVSIHNSYADKSYIALKVDPIGVMPVMFAVVFFMIPQLVIRLLLRVYTDAPDLQRIYERMNLQDSLGVAVYLGIILLLNITFSFIMLSPGEMAEQLQKGGDSIVGIYAGKKTKWYLRKMVLGLSVFSGCIMCLMIGTSLGLSLKGEISPELALFPSMGMMMVGMFCSLFREVRAYRRFDSYSFFI